MGAGGSQAASGARVPARRPLGAGGSPARVPWRRACRRRAPRREAGGRGARAHDASFPRCFTKVPVSVATCDLCCARGPSTSLARFAVSSVSSSPSVCSFGSHVAQSHACLCSAVHGPSVCSLGSHASRRFSVSTLGSHVSRPAPQARLASVRIGHSSQEWTFSQQARWGGRARGRVTPRRWGGLRAWSVAGRRGRLRPGRRQDP